MTKREKSMHLRIAAGAVVVFIAMLLWFLGTVPR
jgi:hypothetical protein